MADAMTQAGSPGSQLPLALRLRERRDFSTFIARGNEPLVGQLQMLAQGGEHQLFLRGEAGSGRTHLLEATVQRVLDHGGGACLLPAQELLGLSPAVLEGLEGQSLVALDDMDALAGREDWEEALFHLYNRCRATGCAWLVAASDAPRHLGLMLPDLATRLAAGGVYRVHPLDEPGLLSLLQQRARERGLVLESEVAEYIIRRHDRSPVRLCETLDQLDREALARKRRLTVPLVREVLGW
jgi:DnaA family protein